LDAALLERPGNKDNQLDLFLNYASNLVLYPVFQQYFRDAKPPLLAIWGKHDPFLFGPERRRIAATIPMPSSSCWTSGILRSKRTWRRSPRRSTD
jgi:hypothetical protein